MDVVIQILLAWIAANSSYSVMNVPPPAIDFMTSVEITAEYYGEHPEFIPDSGIDDRILALYDPTGDKHGVVYLRVDRKEQFQIERELRMRYVRGLHAASLVEGSRATPKVLDDVFAMIFDKNPILTERLLHELVHHVQYQSGTMAKFTCTALGEKEAYRLGGLYFNRHHVVDPMPNRNFWANAYSRC